MAFNAEFAQRGNLNDVYYTACSEYTMYVQTGTEAFKANAEMYFKIYKERGGKRKKLIMHR